MSTLIDLLVTTPTLTIALAALLGLMLGSFLNVVVHRLPRMLEQGWRDQCHELLESEAPPVSERLSLTAPPSRCPHCKHAIGPLENIPLVSYLLQKGRCKHCGASISARYPSVELLTALLSAAVAWKFGFGWPLGFALALTWALVALSFIDYDTQLLPDDITLPLLWLGLMANMNGLFVPLNQAVMGAMAGYLVLWGVFHLFRLLTGKEGMGYGDFKLLAALGAWLGWEMLPLIIILSSLVGAVSGVLMVTLGNHERNKPIPFGPYLAAAGWLALMWGPLIVTSYLEWAKPH